MSNQKIYDTVSEAVNDLVKRGYTADLVVEAEKDCIVCSFPPTELSPGEFEIDEIHRFEGATDPGDEMIVYAISSKDHSIKGIIVNAFGMYASNRESKIVEHLSKHL